MAQQCSAVRGKAAHGVALLGFAVLGPLGQGAANQGKGFYMSDIRVKWVSSSTQLPGEGIVVGWIHRPTSDRVNGATYAVVMSNRHFIEVRIDTIEFTGWMDS